MGGNQSIAFTGSSLVCSLGLDPAGACAAMRAGIVRGSTIDTFVVGTRDDPGGATVHAAPVITHGFEGDARVLTLLHAALDGLQTRGDVHWETARTAFYLSLPHPDREHTGFELITDEDLRQGEIRRWHEIQAARLDPDWMHRATTLLERAAVLANWAPTVHLRAFTMNGNTGVAEMIEAAARDLSAGTVELALVGGVDSLVDGASLRWLEQRGRLKSPAASAGLAPGEAGGFLVMETLAHAQSRRAEVVAALLSTMFDREQNSQLTGQISVGESVALLLARLASETVWSSLASPWLIVDQNGESYRAHEWGCVLTRLIDAHPGFQDPVLWYPVSSVGETGAAAGIVQTNMALQAFERGYAPARQVVLLACADSGERSAMLLEACR